MSFLKAIIIFFGSLITLITQIAFANNVDRSVVAVLKQENAAIVQTFDYKNQKTWFETCRLSTQEIHNLKITDTPNFFACEQIGEGGIALIESDIENFNFYFNQSMEDFFDDLRIDELGMTGVSMFYTTFLGGLVGLGANDHFNYRNPSRLKTGNFIVLSLILITDAYIGYRQYNRYNNVNYVEISIEYRLEKNYHDAIKSGIIFSEKFRSEAERTNLFSDISKTVYSATLDSIKYALTKTRTKVL